MKRKLASFWDGSPLGPLEGLPPGVELRDANEILSTQRIVTHRKSGSVALFSDLFRYAVHL